VRLRNQDEGMVRPSTLLRRAARALVRHVAGVLSRRRSAFFKLIERELESIESDCAALIWAIGCVWAVDVERFVYRARPVLAISLLTAGLYVTSHWLVTHLTWYGLPRPVALGSTGGPPREFLKFGVFLGLFALILTVTPGRRRRRIFAAAVFPLLAWLALPATALGAQIVTAVGSINALPDIVMIGSGLAFGLIVASVLSLPFALLYRARAVPIALLALLPPIAKTVWTVDAQMWSAHPYTTFVEYLWPFACSWILMIVFTRACYRCLHRLPGSSPNPETE